MLVGDIYGGRDYTGIGLSGMPKGMPSGRGCMQPCRGARFAIEPHPKEPRVVAPAKRLQLTGTHFALFHACSQYHCKQLWQDHQPEQGTHRLMLPCAACFLGMQLPTPSAWLGMWASSFHSQAAASPAL